MDQLGTADDIAGPEDVALPPGKSSLRTELCRRTWALLVYLDQKGSINGTAGPTISACSYDTAPPRNCDDGDLSPHKVEVERAHATIWAGEAVASGCTVVHQLGEMSGEG